MLQNMDTITVGETKTGEQVLLIRVDATTYLVIVGIGPQDAPYDSLEVAQRVFEKLVE